jgi:hypothetical protein
MDKNALIKLKKELEKDITAMQELDVSPYPWQVTLVKLLEALLSK